MLTIKIKSMEEKTIIEQVRALLEGENEHKQSRIIEIETAEHKRRGLLRGYIPEENVIIFSWIPKLDPRLKRIELTDLEIITVLCTYKPEQILSIN